MKTASHILRIPSYPPELPHAALLRMASNENCYGPSPHVIEVMREILPQANRYPNENGYALREAIGHKLHVPVSQIILGNGSTEIAELIARTYLQLQDNAVTAEQTFMMYPIAVESTGASCRQIPNKDFGYDLQAILAALDGNTRVVYIANPNNPTGLMIRKPEMDAFLAAVPSNIVVVLDEAYGEYVEDKDYPNGLYYVSEFPNVVVLRTFSKVHSLAGLRIRYGIAGDEIGSDVNRIRAPYNTNVVAQAAALAALEDMDHVQKSKEWNRRERFFLESKLHSLGVRFLPSTANFILLILPDTAAVSRQLAQRGVLVRAMQRFHVPDGLRVTIGTHEENVSFLEALQDVLERVHG